MRSARCSISFIWLVEPIYADPKTGTLSPHSCDFSGMARDFLGNSVPKYGEGRLQYRYIHLKYGVYGLTRLDA
ncbi:hypothetical protein BDV19DRAFT_363103 [Aspergillus venezuelensis]